MRGFFEIGIFGGKTPDNLGMLWRSAYQLGAAGIFTIGARYKRNPTDTLKTPRHIPLRQFDTFEQFNASRPWSCQLVAVEMGGVALADFTHPHSASYLLGSEDNGLPADILRQCQHVVSLQSVRTNSYNVAISGALVMYDRAF